MANKKHDLSAAAKNRMKNFGAVKDLRNNRNVQRKKDNRLALVLSAVAVVVAYGAQFGYGYFQQVSASPSASNVAPLASVAQDRIWNGSFNLNGAAVNIELDGKNAPQAVANFVTLARNGFYEQMNCHRLTTEGIYVLQCGDPSGNGTGGPGYSWGPIENAPGNDKYAIGTLAMARAGNNANSMGSQFFIVYADSNIPSDSVGGYTVFGKITSGIEALQPIVAAGVADGSSDGHPKLKTTISAVKVN